VVQLGLNCQDCDETLQKERGCHGRSLIPHYVGQEEYRKCPIRLVDKGTWDYFKAYRLYKAGYLPSGGGWINESAKYVDAMIVIDNEIDRIRIAEEANARKKTNGRSKT